MMDMGYDVGMMFVIPDSETSIERDKNRTRTLGCICCYSDLERSSGKP